MADTSETAPLLLLTALGVLAGGGWLIVLGSEPEKVDDAPAPVLSPSALSSGPTPLDEAVEAVARSSGQGSIRCKIDAGSAKWPFAIAHREDGVLRAVVTTGRGSRLLWAPEADPKNDAPLGLLEWSGAEKGRVGGCKLVPTGRSTIEGTVTVDDSPATDIRVRVCGETLQADGTGNFSVQAWAGQHCLAYVSEPGVTQDFAPVVVPMKGPASVSLAAERRVAAGDTEPIKRRVVVARTALPERALRNDELSEPARALLETWAREGLEAEAERTELAKEVDSLDEPAPEP